MEDAFACCPALRSTSSPKGRSISMIDIRADGYRRRQRPLALRPALEADDRPHFARPRKSALENPRASTGRKVLKRDPYALHIDTILKRAAELGVAVEHNASPARADLNDLHLRLAKQHGCKITVNTDAHSTDELDQIRYGITQLRRAWLTKEDLINTQPTAELY